VLSDKQWDYICDKNPKGINEEWGTLEGHEYVMFGTKNGDGEFSNMGWPYQMRFSVDSGVIGCIPLAAFPKDTDFDDGEVVIFGEEFTCWQDNGVLWFGDIGIDTD
jgi:hypothetical protein